ncbi:MAG: DNA-3-methyladenine glycosylase 2 family protein [Pelagibacteraceae bacterium]|nr:DNA-3-methyladenine glycosylase 2 family protein [Pelagibacteraceae bacterium]MBO6488724.1 DNA-3-methyladenine glycosylase 2 family protein [Pelagibacteraceae bacterium]
MARLIKSHKGHLTTRNDVFFSLCKSIISQQISVAAASSIFSRFNKACKKKIKPSIISKLSTNKIKACGLSKQKAKGIKCLANDILSKKFDPKKIKKMHDEEAIEYLSQLKQIGRWSAEMILMFTFNRPNIWPVLDLGLQKAISKNYKKKYLPPRSFVEKLHKKFSPMCTIAVWYLWRSIDNDPIQY